MTELAPEKNEDISTIVELWWKKIQQKEKPYYPTKYRAELKRCHEPVAALTTEGFQSLWKLLPQEQKQKSYSLLSWASIACFLAYITHDDVIPFARSLGKRDPKTDTAAVSPLRFAQLQNARSEDEFFTRMIRAIKLIDKKCSVQSVRQETLCWYKEQTYPPTSSKHRLAVRWAMEYYS